MRTFLLVAGVTLAVITSACGSLQARQRLTDPGPDQLKKASEWVASLQLHDPAKEARVTSLIANQLTEVRDWHNAHAYTETPDGINPYTGARLTNMDRLIIVDSAIPDSVHRNLMDGLYRELDTAQVDAILDRYTVGKVAFTLKGYRAIVPDLTATEKSVILANLTQAREQAIDFKNMKEVSAIFEIYKTKCEAYLNAHGRNWRSLYKAYVEKIKAEKAAGKAR